MCPAKDYDNSDLCVYGLKEEGARNRNDQKQWCLDKWKAGSTVFQPLYIYDSLQARKDKQSCST